MKSFLNVKNAPRGIRNNNPGNLVLTAINWQGKIPAGQNTDGHFEQFQDIYHGIRAMATDVINDIAKGKDTIAQLIAEYAPASENNTTAYIQKVASDTGINAHAKIPRNLETIQRLITSMIAMENGSAYRAFIDQEDINQGISMIATATRAKLLASQTAQVMRENPFKTIAIAIGLIWIGWSLIEKGS